MEISVTEFAEKLITLLALDANRAYVLRFDAAQVEMTHARLGAWAHDLKHVLTDETVAMMCHDIKKWLRTHPVN